MPNDKFFSTDSVTSPAREGFAIVPDDGLQLVDIPKAIYVGTGGDITLRLVDSAQDVTLRNVGNGAILDVRPSAIRATGTSAANIVGLL